MLYNYKNITIGRFEDVLTDFNELKRFNIWLPKKYLAKKVGQLVKQYHLENNEKENNSKLNDAFEQVSIINKANNLYSSLYLGFQTCYKIVALTGIKPKIMSDLEEVFRASLGIEPTPENIKRLPIRIEKLKAVFESLKKEDDSDFTFSDLINKMEALLPFDPRQRKLRYMGNYIKLAISRSKQKNNEQN